MFRYPGFGYSEMSGQFRLDIAAVQKNLCLGCSGHISMSLIKSCTREGNWDMCWLLDMLKSKKRPK